MTALVTGASGFVGSHLVRALLERGREVRCLVRPSSPRSRLEQLGVEIVEGDLRDDASIRSAVRGARTVFHCAADYRLWASDPAEIYQANVDGTRSVMEASLEEGVERVVYTSSVAALGLTPDGTPADEQTPIHFGDVVGVYKRSKFLAERVVSAFVARGLPAVIVNPSTPVGEGDVRPTPTGQIVVDFMRGRMKAYVDTGLNLVDVRDVAEGHLLAAEKGAIGRRYILGNRNLELKAIFDLLSPLTGVRSPRLRLPHWVPFGAALADTAFSRMMHREPRLPLDAVRMSKKKMYFDSTRAVTELGFPQTPVEQALARAVDWFRGRDEGCSPPESVAPARQVVESVPVQAHSDRHVDPR